MGNIINVTEGESDLPEALTNTIKSGFRSGEYLADRPAITYVEEGETVEYVLTNSKKGIAIAGDTTRHVLPDSRYQTVCVVTDRRVLALVGKMGGDEQLTLDLTEVTGVETESGRRTGELLLQRDDGVTYCIHTEADGLREVADFIKGQCAARQAPGRVRAATQSIRGLFGATVDSAKSFERDQVAELIPALDDSPPGPVGRTIEASAEASTATPADSRDAGSEGSEKPDKETAIDDILQALAKTDWRARGAEPESPFDLLAEREDELVGVVVHCPDNGEIDRDVIKRCDAITGAAGTDTVMLATTGTVRTVDARLAADRGVRLRNVATMSDTSDPPMIEAVTEMVSKVLSETGWDLRPEAAGPFDLLAECGDELMGVVVHSPEDGTVRDSIERCDTIMGAAGTDTVMLATTGTVRGDDEQLAEDLGVRLVESDSLASRHVTEVVRE